MKNLISQVGLVLGLLLYFTFGIHGWLIHHPDEARYSAISLSMWRHHQWLVPQVLGTAFLDKPPLFYYCQMLAYQLLGPTLVALRLPSILASAFSIWLVYAITAVHTDRPTGWRAALILATMPLQFVMSHYGNLDMLFAAWLTASLCCYWMAQQRQHAGGWYLAMTIGMALAVLTKGLMGVVLPMLVVTVHQCCQALQACPSALGHQRPRWLLQGQAALGCGLLVAPWFVAMHYRIPNFTYYFIVEQHFWRYVSHGFNNHHACWFYMAVLLYGSLPWSLVGLALLYQCHQITAHTAPPMVWYSQAAKLGNFAALCGGAILVFFALPASKSIGYVLPCLPFLAICLALGLQSVTLPRAVWLAIAMSAVLVGGMAHLWAWWQHCWFVLFPSGILMMAGLSGCWWHQRGHHSGGFGLTLVGCVCFQLALMAVLPAIPQSTSQHIMRYLARFPQLPIAVYRDMFYDVLYYLPESRFQLVDDWQRGLVRGDTLKAQFALGLAAMPSPQFIDETHFRHRWQQPQPMVVLTNDGYASRFFVHGNCLLMHEGPRWLFYNRDCGTWSSQTAIAH